MHKVAITVGTTVLIDPFVPFFDKGFDAFDFNEPSRESPEDHH